MYFSMHNHTDYSNLRLIDAIVKVPRLIDGAIDLGLEGIAITDHDSLSGHVKALKHFKDLKTKAEAMLKKENLPNKERKWAERVNTFTLALGNEIYLTKNGLTRDNYDKQDFNHFILIAKDEIGHKQLRELSTRAWGRSFVHFVERVPTYYSDVEEIIGDNKGHLIATTACLGGYLGKLVGRFLLLQEGDEKDGIRKGIARFLTWCKTWFPSDFYLELQPSQMVDQQNYNKALIALSSKYQIPIIAATDSHYLSRDERKIHEAYLKSKDGEREVADFYSSAYLMNYEEIFAMLGEHLTQEQADEALNNTLKVKEKITSYDLFHKQVIPKIPLPLIGNLTPIASKYEYINKFILSENEYDKYYIHLILTSLENKCPKNEYETWLNRIEQELAEVWEVSERINDRLSSYFITTKKVIDIMWEEGDSLVGVARGSAAGFLTNYLLGIIQINPLKQGIEMPHWRFVHRDRPELADIDIDSEANKREQIFNALKKYFMKTGGDVVNVCTFGTEGAKSAIQTACRGLGYDSDIALYLSSLVPSERGKVRTLKECYYGNEEEGWPPLQQFKNEIAKYPGLWEVASQIEGLIKQRGIHASGVLAFNTAPTEHNAIMKAPNGNYISQYELYDSEYMGGIKIDMLSIDALDKIRVAMNLMLEHGYMEWEGTLRETYNKNLHPDVLDYDSPAMWEMVAKQQVLDLFQFHSTVGLEAAKRIQPTSVLELSQANTLMRLMVDMGQETPSETYVRYKEDIKHWHNDMITFGLVDSEIDLLHKHLGVLRGVADSQESIMLLVMDPNIANFSVPEANKLRKGIARKKKEIIAEVKELLYSKGKEAGASTKLLDYVWDVVIHRQVGYSFSVLHSTSYSLIALQELNLVYKYPPIFWNTACLTVNAGAIDENDEWDDIDVPSVITDDDNDEDDDEEIKKSKSKSTNYGKIATAIGNMQSNGITVALPDINRAKFSFFPDLEKGEILFGLKGITRISDTMVADIIANRPYESTKGFIKKLKPTKTQMINLIKAGCFDGIEARSRVELMKEYIESICGKKHKVTLQNMNALIENKLLPDELKLQIGVYSLNKYLKDYKVKQYFAMSDSALRFYQTYFDPDLLRHDGEFTLIEQKTWDKQVYQKQMDKVREWIKANHAMLLDKLNNILFQEEWDKYCEGPIARWEMDSLSYYYHPHELADVTYSDSVNFFNLPETPIIESFTHFNGMSYPRYKLSQIIGTVLDRDKIRHTVSLLTVDGVVTVKLYRSQFAKYDAQLSQKDSKSGKKTVVEKGWFKRGNQLVFTGFRRNDQFVVKTYKNHYYLWPIGRITNINDDNTIEIATERVEIDEK